MELVIAFIPALDDSKQADFTVNYSNSGDGSMRNSDPGGAPGRPGKGLQMP
jgi:hypothetical protein